MIAHDDRGIGILRALDFADHIPDDAALVVLLRYEVDFYAAGTQVIPKGQRALPALRYAGAFEGLQDRRGVVVADRDGDDVRLIAIGLKCERNRAGRAWRRRREFPDRRDT